MTSEQDATAKALAEAILAASGDAVLATDRHGRIQFWNPGAARIFGFTAEDAVGASLDLIIPERLRKRHWEGWNRVMSTGEPSTARPCSKSPPCTEMGIASP